MKGGSTTKQSNGFGHPIEMCLPKMFHFQCISGHNFQCTSERSSLPLGNFHVIAFKPILNQHIYRLVLLTAPFSIIREWNQAFDLNTRCRCKRWPGHVLHMVAANALTLEAPAPKQNSGRKSLMVCLHSAVTHEPSRAKTTSKTIC